MSVLAALFHRFRMPFRLRVPAADPRDIYPVLEAYYHNNDLYAALEELRITQPVRARPLRNPAHAVVEFYAATLWGAARIEADDPTVVGAAQQVLEWSNWDALRQRLARWLALYGDAWIKVATRQDNEGRVRRVFLQLIHPAQVREFAEDERGFLTAVVIESPTGDGKQLLIERWDKATGTVTWELAPQARAERGEPVQQATVAELGFDFIPVVHLRFRDIGEPRGIGAFTQALDLIDEANRMATRLVELMYRYNRPDLVLRQVESRDPLGRPLPPPDWHRARGSDTYEIGAERVTMLPPGYELTPILPHVDWGSYLSALDAHLAAIERYALPELTYYRLADLGSPSGRALRIILAPALSRVAEVRRGMDAGCARALEMALSIGSLHGLFAVPPWEAGQTRVRFSDRPLLPEDEYAELEHRELKTRLALLEKQLGLPMQEILRRLGYDGATAALLVEQSLQEQERERERMANLLAAGWEPT